MLGVATVFVQRGCRVVSWALEEGNGANAFEGISFGDTFCGTQGNSTRSTQGGGFDRFLVTLASQSAGTVLETYNSRSQQGSEFRAGSA